MLAVLDKVNNKELSYFSEYVEDQLEIYIPFKRAKENEIKNILKKKIKKYFNNNFNKNPSIILDIIYIDE